MMHPDHIDKLMAIVRMAAIALCVLFTFRVLKAVYYALQ